MIQLLRLALRALMALFSRGQKPQLKTEADWDLIPFDFKVDRYCPACQRLTLKVVKENDDA